MIDCHTNKLVKFSSSLSFRYRQTVLKIVHLKYIKRKKKLNDYSMESTSHFYCLRIQIKCSSD